MLKSRRYLINAFLNLWNKIPTSKLRGVAQLVARVVWDHEAGGSSPLTPTKLES